jgi:golgi-specific brefeldin A-resistance guanine nucleotide exchange factor 1
MAELPDPGHGAESSAEKAASQDSMRPTQPHGLLDVPSIDAGGAPLRGMDPTPLRVAIAVDPVALVTTECITVTSAMRKHARWAHSSVSAILGSSTSMQYRKTPSNLGGAGLARAQSKRQGSGAGLGDVPKEGNEESFAGRWGLRGRKGKSMQDNPLMSAFSRLRMDLRGCTGG